MIRIFFGLPVFFLSGWRISSSCKGSIHYFLKNMDKDFHDLLRRYVNGSCTAEEIEKVNQWYAEIADRELHVDEEEKTNIKARMLANIQKILPSQDQSFRKYRYGYLLSHSAFKVAAAILVFVACGLWLFTSRDPLTADNHQGEISKLSDATVFENKSDSSEVYKLSDGSTVQLEPSGKIRFERNFPISRREIHLTGKAFFDIVKDPARPFYVISGEIATRVLGTSFFVNAPANTGKVEVKVITGKVSVFQIIGERLPKDEKPSTIENATNNGVVLLPNQKVEYFIEDGRWVTGLVKDPVPVKPIKKDALSFVFDNTSLKAVLADVSKRYGIEVLTDNEKIYECTFTGDVSRMSLYDMLDVISNSIGSTYEVKGTRILVSGKGCD